MIGFKTIEEFNLAECEEYLKRTDISESERQRTIRRKAQVMAIKKPEPQLVSPKTVLERFPNIKFVMNPKRSFIPSWFWWTIIIQLGVVLYSLGVMLAVFWIVYHKRRNSLKNCFIEETNDKFKLVADLYKLGIYNKNTLRILVPIEYDNIDKIGSDYFVVEKNGKKGVYKRKKTIIPVEYDKMDWNNTNNVFYAEKNGRQIIIDINGNEVG